MIIFEHDYRYDRKEPKHNLRPDDYFESLMFCCKDIAKKSQSKIVIEKHDFTYEITFTFDIFEDFISDCFSAHLFDSIVRCSDSINICTPEDKNGCIEMKVYYTEPLKAIEEDYE